MQDDQGVWHDIAKRPATDMAKASKAGRQATIMRDGKLVAAREDAIDPVENLLVQVWRNGELLVRHDFERIRERAAV